MRLAFGEQVVTTRIPIRYATPWPWLLPLLWLPARVAYIQIDGDTMQVRMGWAFRATFARGDVIEVVDHRPVVSIGVHGWNGRWLVNGAHRPIATDHGCARRPGAGCSASRSRCASCS